MSHSFQRRESNPQGSCLVHSDKPVKLTSQKVKCMAYSEWIYWEKIGIERIRTFTLCREQQAAIQLGNGICGPSKSQFPDGANTTGWSQVKDHMSRTTCQGPGSQIRMTLTSTVKMLQPDLPMLQQSYSLVQMSLFLKALLKKKNK